MSKRSVKIIKRSLLPLAPLASLTLGGCGLLGGFGFPHARAPYAPPQAAAAEAPATTGPAGETNPDAQRDMLAFADRLAKADKEAAMSQAATGAAAAPTTAPSSEGGIASAEAARETTASGVDKAVVPAGAPEGPAIGAGPGSAEGPVVGTMANVGANPRETTAGISAMGAMNATAAPPFAMLTANGPSPGEAGTGATLTEPSIDAVLDLLRHRVQARPQELNYSLALTLLESAEMRKTDDPALAALTPCDQKLVSDLSAAVDAISAEPVSASTTLADRTAPLVAASNKWQADGDLKLPRLALATRVDSFGVYTPIDARFQYGKQQTVIIYCEVANFTVKRNDDGWYETLLSQQDTLTTDDGLLVWRPNAEDVEDRSMNRRHDFYLVKKLTIPDNLAIGKYTLKMSVTDKLAKKRAEITMPIEIVGK